MKSNCENCANYVYDDYDDFYTCEAQLDEDEMGRFLTHQTKDCPYFSFYDEYSIVKKQN
jgi:hypothetical protein